MAGTSYIYGKNKSEPVDFLIFNSSSKIYPIEAWQAKESSYDLPEHLRLLKSIENELEKSNFNKAKIITIHQEKLKQKVEFTADFFEQMSNNKNITTKEFINSITKIYIKSDEYLTIAEVFDSDKGKIRREGFDFGDVVKKYHKYSILQINDIKNELILSILKKTDLLGINYDINEITDSIIPKLNFILEDIKGKNTPFKNLIDSLKLPSKPVIKKDDYSVKNILLYNQKLLTEKVEDTSIQLQNLYIENNVIEYKISKKFDFENKILNNEKTSYQVVKKWLESKEKFNIILGDFGYGKSLLLKYLAGKLSNNNNEYIPLYIPLRLFFNSSVSFDTIIQNTLEYRYQVKYTDELWKENKWLLLCDGFDELSFSYQNSIEKVFRIFTLIELKSKLDNVKVLLSSRPLIFVEEQLSKKILDSYNNIKLCEFNENQIKQWITQFNKLNKDNLSFNMIKEHNLLDVAKTPVLLYLISSVSNKINEATNKKLTRANIYQFFFDQTVDNGGLDEKDISIPKHMIGKKYRKILGEIAWKMFSHSQSINGVMLHIDLLYKELTDNKLFRSVVSEKHVFLAHALRETEKKGYIEFIHKSLREFLIAEKIVNTFKVIVEKSNDLSSINWEEIITDIPITIFEVEFIKEIVTTLEEDDRYKLAKYLHETYLFKNILDILIKLNYINNTLNEKKEYMLCPKSDDISLNKIQYKNQIVFGNLALFSFLLFSFSRNSLNDFSYSGFEGLSQISNILKSDPSLETLFNILKECFKKTDIKDIKINSYDFELFNFDNSNLEIDKIKDCSFSNTKFCKTILKGIPANEDDASFTNCIFDKNNWNEAVISNLEFRNCMFNSIERENSFNFQNVTFRNCIFKNSYIVSDYFSNNAQFLGCDFIECNFVTLDKTKKVPPFANCTFINRNTENKQKWKYEPI
uniref:NACHT domain-containing protein n=1 Tax=Aliarcobacter sp. TaxID=2321116 RepID=UPI004048050C